VSRHRYDKSYNSISGELVIDLTIILGQILRHFVNRAPGLLSSLKVDSGIYGADTSKIV